MADNQHVKAIFMGHRHGFVGFQCDTNLNEGVNYRSYDNTYGGVPVIFSGSAEYNLYTKATFYDTKMVIESINSVEGKHNTMKKVEFPYRTGNNGEPYRGPTDCQ